MNLEERLLWWQRWAVMVAVIGGSIAVRLGEGDIFGVPKATAVIVCAIAGIVAGACRVALTRRVAVPRGIAVWSAAGLGVAMILSTIFSTQVGQSIVGQYTQDAGLLQYGSYLVLFVVVLRAFRPEQLRLLARVIVGTAAFVSLYAVYQWLGHDPVDWNKPGQVFSVMGNVDFLAGWCGAVAPVAVMLALWKNEYLEWRILAAVTAVAVAFASYASHSFQGPMSVAAGVGLFFFLLVLPRARSLVPRVPRLLLAGGLLVVVVLGAAIAPRVNTAVRGGIDNGLLDRRYFWAAALETGRDNPIIGTGLDTFHNQYERRRPLGQAKYRGENAGAAHSVPLDMWANGGILLLAAYLLFVGYTAWRFFVGIRQLDGDRRYLLLGFGSAWFGYQVESAVSIDKPALAVMHFVLAGTVHVLAGVPEWPERAIGRAVASAPGRGRRPIDQRDVSGGAVAVTASVVAIGLVAAWFGFQPMRADLIYASGVKQLGGDPAAAAGKIRHALALNPYEARYTYDLSRAYVLLQDGKRAVAAAGRGVHLEPGDSSYATYAGSLAADNGQVALARRFYDHAVENDPLGLDSLLAAARFEAQAGNPPKARALVARALAVTELRYDVWTKAANVYDLLKDTAAADNARARAKALAG